MKKHCLTLKRHSAYGIWSLILVLLTTFHTWAQAPKMFNFQGVARDASGKVVANGEIGYSFTIHKGTPNGQSVFTSDGTTNTNSSGIFNLTIGTGASPLPDLQWSSESYYLQVSVDPDGAANGSSFTDVGTTQLLSVPYSLYANEAGKWADHKPIVQTGSLGSSPILPSVAYNIVPTMIWYPRKAAFRVGSGSESSWGDASIGTSSFAAGFSPKAMGSSSIALGNEAKATFDNSVAIGSDVEANAVYAVSIGYQSIAHTMNSVAIGYMTAASGKGSTSLGWGTSAKAVGSVAAGLFNNDSDNPSPSVANSTDRLFQMGNGVGSNNRSNALTILRNGNIGIGNNTLAPEFILDVGGRARMKHNGATSGIHFNNSANVAEGFVGMVHDNAIGFYIANAWRLVVGSDGIVSANNFFETSDKRLKKNIRPLNSCLPGITRLQGYTYNWKDPKNNPGLQTGLIAQEVEIHYPELVNTDKQGFKSVNYTGLIPHLIEAVKELDQKTQEIAELKKELADVRRLNKRMTDMEASLKALLTGNTSATGKTHTK